MVVKRIIRSQNVAQRANGHNNFDNVFVGQRTAVARLADVPSTRD